MRDRDPESGTIPGPPLGLEQTADLVRFGKFDLVCLLGEGGMARVYRAVLSGSMGFQKVVALKRIDPRMTQDERFVKALVNEARLGGQLHHRNIVEIYEFSQFGDQFLLAMEYVDGWTLNTVLASCRAARRWVPATVVAEIVAGVCEGLRYAHDATDAAGRPTNLVHRDLKPGNLILSRSGEVKILDFGIAKADTNLYQTTDAGSVKGTPAYMSPEQVLAQPLDRRSDLFSLGGLLHELITLSVPYPGANVMSVMQGILHDGLQRPSQRVGERHPEFVPLIERLLAPEVANRCSDAGEAARLLADARGKLPPGPTLAEWLQEMEGSLPPRPRDGDFGEVGPPQATRPPELVRTRAMGSEPTPPRATVKRWSRAPLIAGVTMPLIALAIGLSLPRGPGNESEPRAAMVDPSSTVPEAAHAAVASAREPQGAPSSVVGPGGVEPTAAEPGVGPTVVAGPGFPSPVVTPAPLAPPAEQRPKGARGAGKPAPGPETTEPTPSEAGPTPTGTVDFNTDPWSQVTVDGRALGPTPQRGITLSAGPHSVTFVCGPCDPAQSKTVPFLVRAGERQRETTHFGTAQ